MERYQQLRRLAYFEIALYFTILFAGRTPAQAAGFNKNAFSSARQRWVYPRMLFLNLGLATHLVSTMKESKLRNYMAEKYFSHLQYIPPAGATNPQPMVPIGQVPPNVSVMGPGQQPIAPPQSNTYL
ncbi:hypothetical protein FGO68_gene7778 [Halteria grandinella]|uniref:Uncharacterized protein n=1 Tax=Halteria grandinella TaxID=5974 RepID=A0A8J8T7N3_HALGN|nr:hypothetical protein FGO68_gene7778 [Halteria grandinella]